MGNLPPMGTQSGTKRKHDRRHIQEISTLPKHLLSAFFKEQTQNPHIFRKHCWSLCND